MLNLTFKMQYIHVNKQKLVSMYIFLVFFLHHFFPFSHRIGNNDVIWTLDFHSIGGQTLSPEFFALHGKLKSQHDIEKKFNICHGFFGLFIITANIP